MLAAPPMVEPAFLWVPEHVSTAGGEAADLAAELGISLEPEQRLVLDAVLAEKQGGRWAAFEAAIVAPRQNLKTLLCELVCIADLWLGFGSELIVWTAHETDTAEESRLHIKEHIETHPFLSRRVRKIVEANGEEGFELVDGKRLRFKARTKAGGRGLAGDRVILDEAFALQPAHMGSLMPTMSAKSQTGNPQIVYASSAGHLKSAVLRSIRDRGRRGGDQNLVYAEWCAPRRACALGERCNHLFGVDGCVLDDVELVNAANLQLGRRIAVSFVMDTERRAMPPEEFARERLGWWDEPEELVDGLDLATWESCKDESSQLATVEAWAVAPARDLSWSAIAVAGRRADGLAHVEVVEYRKGTHWVADRLVELRAEHGDAAVFLEAKGPRSSLSDDFDEVEVGVSFVSSDEMASACGLLFDDLLRSTVRHIGQAELDVSVRGAQRRQVGDAWVWSRAASMVEISPLVAATLALWGARQATVEREPFVVVS